MRKGPAEPVKVKTPEAKLIEVSGINIGELVKVHEKQYTARFTQNIETISVVAALDAYFEELKEDVVGFYSTEKHNVFTILTEYGPGH